MKTGIQRFSVKLVDLRKKLDYTYKDLCSVSIIYIYIY